MTAATELEQDLAECSRSLRVSYDRLIDLGADLKAMEPVVASARRVLASAHAGLADIADLPPTAAFVAARSVFNEIIAAFEEPLNHLDATLGR